MGYDLHLTRKRFWADADGPEISLAEWRAVVEQDAELTFDRENSELSPTIHQVNWMEGAGVLWYQDGEILAKNPDKSLIVKMVTLAHCLSAKVQGDDGETYRDDGTAIDAPAAGTSRQSLFGLFRSWMSARRAAQELQAAAPNFKKRQRVKDPWGNEGTIIKVRPGANSGLGLLIVCYDDGRRKKHTLVASGLEIIS